MYHVDLEDMRRNITKVIDQAYDVGGDSLINSALSAAEEDLQTAKEEGETDQIQYLTEAVTHMKKKLGVE